MSPRPFERPATIALPELEGLPAGAALDGLWLPARGDLGARGGAVVAAPHPLMGGSMDSPVVNELAHACDRELSSDTVRDSTRRAESRTVSSTRTQPGDGPAKYRATRRSCSSSEETTLSCPFHGSNVRKNAAYPGVTILS